MEIDGVTLLAAFLVGLTGGVHCVGMCGGVVGALGFGLPESVRGRLAGVLPFLLAYNLGRLLSYIAAGALMGGIGLAAARMAALHDVRLVLQVIAGLFMIALGFYLAGWWYGITRLERIGGRVWRLLEPVGRRLLPVHSVSQALLFGLVWGWLPCGLVYSVLIWSLSAGGVAEGALLMAAFGLGTLPSLLAMGFFAARLSTFLRRPAVRRAAGAAVILFGLWSVVRAFL